MYAWIFAGLDDAGNRQSLRYGRHVRYWVLLLMMIWGGEAAAHMPAGGQFGAFQFPGDLLPQIDGDLGDWAIAGPPAVTTTDLRDLVGEAAADPTDFDVRVWIGWNDAANRLLIAAEVVDDQHQVDRPEGTVATRIFLDDDMEVFIDADHSGGQFADFADLSQIQQLARNGADANHFILAGPHADGEYFVNFSAAVWYALADGPHTQAAVSFSGTPGGAGITRYEFSVRPYNRVNVTADFLSSEHDLQAREIIGFNLEFNDFDVLSEVFEAKWSLSGGQNAFRLSQRFADLRLLPLEARFRPTVVEEISWARIKASFGAR